MVEIWKNGKLYDTTKSKKIISRKEIDYEHIEYEPYQCQKKYTMMKTEKENYFVLETTRFFDDVPKVIVHDKKFNINPLTKNKAIYKYMNDFDGKKDKIKKKFGVDYDTIYA